MSKFFTDTYVAFMVCVAVWAVLDAVVRACLLVGDVLTPQRKENN